MEDREFDKLFSTLKHREIPPSDKAFMNLQNALNQEEKKGLNLKAIWWAAAVVSILLVSIGVYNTTQQELPIIEITQVKPEIVEEVLAPKELPAQLIAEHGKTKEEPVKEIAEIKQRIEPPVSTTKEKQLAATIEKQLPETVDAEPTQTPNRFEGKALQLTEEKERILAGLLKPVEDTELDQLLEDKRQAVVTEMLVDKDIQNLLKNAQMGIQLEEDTELALSKANRLLQNAEIELEADKSLKNLFNKAVEIGVVEVKGFLTRR